MTLVCLAVFPLHAQIDKDQKALEALIFFGSVPEGLPEGISSHELGKLHQDALKRFDNLTERLVVLFESHFYIRESLPYFTSINDALKQQSDLTPAQLKRLASLLATNPPDLDPVAKDMYKHITSGVLDVLQSYPGDETRQVAARYLGDSDLTVVAAAIGTLAGIGTFEDLAAARACVDKRIQDTSAYYFEIRRESMIRKYNEFARRLHQPLLPESRQLTPGEVEQVSRAQKEEQAALIRSLLASTGNEWPQPGVTISSGVTGASAAALAATPVAATQKQPLAAKAMAGKDRAWKILGLALIAIIALVLPVLVIRRN